MIKFTQSPIGIGFAYKEGDICQLSEASEKELVERGFAEYVEIEKAVAKPKTEKAVKK